MRRAVLGIAILVGATTFAALGRSNEAPEVPTPVAALPPSAVDPLAHSDAQLPRPVTLIPQNAGPSRAPAPIEVGGLSRFASIDGDGFTMSTDGGDIEFLSGINVGSAIPGRLPAELKVDAETWRRWLPMIAATNVHAIRIYTVQPPYFYEELRNYNLANPDHPLYLIHGVWLPEELLTEHHDMFHPEVLALARQDLDDAVHALHGQASLPERQGYASGIYTADVSPWVVSWAFGIEMDPRVVRDSDAKNEGRSFHGTYFSSTPTASGTEAWLAEMLDRIAGIEASYGITMPLTFSNWPTTDPLVHAYEPLSSEDLVGIDANHIMVSDQWPGGYYASYHAYPYYPDFQRYEPGIADYEFNGQVDAYAGYLVKLRDHHAEAGLSMMVLEFGVPSAVGSAHNGSLGRDQGGHNEITAMEINAYMLRTQHQLGLSGGFVFAWQDEWFKRTWNTMDTELPADRRQLWHNPLTNEANFGLLAMDPGEDGPPVVIDGFDQDWRTTNSQAILESANDLIEVRVTHDEGFLYLRLLLEDVESWRNLPVVIGFDVVPGGNGSLPGLDGFGSRADTAIVVGPDDEANAFVRASNDYNDLVIGARLGFSEYDETAILEGSGAWNPQRLNINRPLTVPGLGIEQPVEWFDLNPLPRGSSGPLDPWYDSTTLWNANDHVIELRVPWGIVGFSDPSSRAGFVVSPDGFLSTHEVDRLGISIAVGDAGFETAGYAWESWNRVSWQERVKMGVDLYIDAVDEVNANPPGR